MMHFFLITLFPYFLLASNLTSLYSTLDQTSVAQHFAFYELYPDTVEGRNALKHAWELLSGSCADCDPEMILPTLDAKPIIALVNRSSQEPPQLLEEELQVIEKLGSSLPHRKRKGHTVWKEVDLFALTSEEIDLARGLLLAEGTDKLKIRNYEASLDLMALQILARLKPDATSLEKIRAINDYIFSELQFRFPPHSLYAKDIDIYTLLPAVLDSRKGVCLGVSILYLSLAQRLNLDLEAITPPGHIYVRHVGEKGDITNIETTARGIDVPSEMYLSLETDELEKRTIKEVIGLAFMNQAAVAWHKEDSKMAITLYEKGAKYLPDDPLLQTFLGFQYLFAGQEKKGKKILEKVKKNHPEMNGTTDTITKDYLSGFASIQAIQAIFQEVDETRSSILKKQRQLETIVKNYPKFRGGIFHLAVTYLQLGREKEAIPILEKYMSVDPSSRTVCYYLSALHAQRMNYLAAWTYLQKAEALMKGHASKTLEDLRASLQRACPEPLK